MPRVDDLNIELFWDDINGRDFIIPGAVCDQQAIRVCQKFFVQEEPNSLNKATFSLHMYNTRKLWENLHQKYKKTQNNILQSIQKVELIN
jgi:hypothetical protein